MIGVAGTVTTLAAVVLGLKAYDPSIVHGTTLSRRQVHDGCVLLATMTRAERASLPVMPPGREDVIVAGVLILEAVMDAFGFSGLTVSETDILDGAAAALLLRSDP